MPNIPVNVGDDCPVFEGLFEYCGLSAGGSMGTSNREDKWFSLNIKSIKQAMSQRELRD